MARKLSDAQINCLWGLALGSKGRGSNARTLDSLRRLGLAASTWHQGEFVWETTREGEESVDAERG